MEESSERKQGRKEKRRRTEVWSEATRPEQGPGMRSFIYVDEREKKMMKDKIKLKKKKQRAKGTIHWYVREKYKNK